jgi:hypothetical protein
VNPKILDGVAQALKVAGAGHGANIAWPAPLRRVERTNPGYKE